MIKTWLKKCKKLKENCNFQIFGKFLQGPGSSQVAWKLPSWVPSPLPSPLFLPSPPLPPQVFRRTNIDLVDRTDFELGWRAAVADGTSKRHQRIRTWSWFKGWWNQRLPFVRQGIQPHMYLRIRRFRDIPADLTWKTTKDKLGEGFGTAFSSFKR